MIDIPTTSIVSLVNCIYVTSLFLIKFHRTCMQLLQITSSLATTCSFLLFEFLLRHLRNCYGNSQRFEALPYQHDVLSVSYRQLITVTDCCRVIPHHTLLVTYRWREHRIRFITIILNNHSNK